MDAERQLVEHFLDAHPSDAAALIEALGADEAAAALAQLPAPTVARALQSMAPSSATECLVQLPADTAGHVVATLPVDAAARLLRRAALETRERILACGPRETANAVHRVMQYPENSAGALMDPYVLALPRDLTVEEAAARVRRAPRNVLYYLYIVDRSQRLVGVVNLRELMLAPPTAELAEVMRSEVTRISAHADHPAIIAHPGWRRLHALPVVDDGGALIGVLRYETLRRLEDEAASAPAAAAALTTVLNLGELCWIGFAGVLAGFATTVAPPRDAEPRAGARS
jgi:magnesium transporter